MGWAASAADADRSFDLDMLFQNARDHISESPRLSSDWLGAAIFVVVALALLIGTLTITLGGGADVQILDATRLPNSQAAPNPDLRFSSPAPTSTARVMNSPVPSGSGPTPTDRPRPRPTITPSPESSTAIAAKPQRNDKPLAFRFGAADWQGGFYGGDAKWYGRTWTAVYSADSSNPRATLSIYLSALPQAPATLTVRGVDDEWAENNPISITVNGVEIFSGPSPFANWDDNGLGEGDVWSQALFAVPAGLLHEGANEITLANLSQSAKYSSTPYVLLSDAILEFDL